MQLFFEIYTQATELQKYNNILLRTMTVFKPIIAN